MWGKSSIWLTIQSDTAVHQAGARANSTLINECQTRRRSHLVNRPENELIDGHVTLGEMH
jgi:hypothetical protein